MKREAGFTLLEVIVAVAILALMSALIFYTLSQVFKTVDIVRADSDILRMARQVTTRVPGELADAYLPANLLVPTSNQKVEFVAEDHGDLDRIRFQAFSHTKFYQDAHESDESVIEYYTENDPRHSGLYRLMRREKTNLDDRPEVGGTTLVMADQIKVFDLKFYDLTKDEWFPSWDTNSVDNANRLPYAMRLKLVFVDSDKRDREFVTSGLLQLAQQQEQR